MAISVTRKTITKKRKKEGPNKRRPPQIAKPSSSWGGSPRSKNVRPTSPSAQMSTRWTSQNERQPDPFTEVRLKDGDDDGAEDS